MLLFLLFTVAAFLPVLLPFFYIKNDLVTQILPTRFIISESIHSGFSPWWNPYLNYGIPAYGDMNCGFWNPVLWLVALFFNYNIWTVSFEEIFYIFLSGWGMFLVLKELNISKKNCILSGFSYMCCGYMIGHMQHFCWITGAAFLPLLFLYFIKINKEPSLKHFITGSMFGFLFLSSTHPGIIIGAIYFFSFSLIALLLFKNRVFKNKIHPSVLKNNLLFLLLTLILSQSLIISYSEVISFITRGEKLFNNDTLSNATTLQSYISLAFPLAVHKSGFFDTDISMRNVYIGFFSVAGFVFFCKNFRTKFSYYILVCLIFFILLSCGNFFKSIANKIVPLASYVRSAGEFTLFPIFIMVICGAFGIQSIASQKTRNFYWDKRIKLAITIFIAALFISVLFILTDRKSVAFSLFSKSIALHDIKEQIKYLLDDSTFWDLLLIQSSLNILTLYFIGKAFARQNKFRIALVLCINLIVICWLTLPFTGLGAKNKKEVNALLSSVPEGIPTQSQICINDFTAVSENFKAFTGMPRTYQKKIGNSTWDPYPIELKNNFNYFNDSNSVKFINKQPFIFLSTDTSINTTVNQDTSAVTIVITGPGYIKATVQKTQFKYITLLQNDYKYWNVFIDGKKTTHFTSYKTFISTMVPGRKFTIEFKFTPEKIIFSVWISLAVLVLTLFFILLFHLKSSPAKNNF